MIYLLRFKSVVACICFAVAILANDLTPVAGAWDTSLDETFSGSGTYAANNGMPGFEIPDWNIAGNGGAFATNGFGEDVFHVESNGTGQNGLFRLLGTEAFSVTAEFSNPDLGIFSAAGINVADSPDVVGLSVLHSGSQFNASFAATVDGSFIGIANMGLGAAVDHFTLLLEYEPDQLNGGGLFNGYIDVNQSGSFTLVGTIDGTQYSSEASLTRTLFAGTSAFENQASVDLDRITISGSAVPEPTSATILVGSLLASLMRRRTRCRQPSFHF